MPPPYDLRQIIAERLRDWEETGAAGPAILEMYPTQKCNLACRTCLQSQLQGTLKFELPDEEFIRIVREAISLGTRLFLIGGGGEPFCRRELVLTLMEMVKSSGRAGTLITNTTMLRESDVEKIVAWDWDVIHCSIDGPNAETNDYLRGPGTFAKAVQVLGWLNRYKEKYQRENPFLIFNFVLSKKNYPLLPEYIRFARDHRASYISINAMILHSPIFRYLEIGEEDKKEALRYLQEAYRLSRELNLPTNVLDLGYPVTPSPEAGVSRPGMINLIALKLKGLRGWLLARRKKKKAGGNALDRAFCLKPWYHLVLQTNGTLGPCCIFQDEGATLYQRSVQEVWEKGCFAGWRRQMLSEELPSACATCPTSMREEDRHNRQRLRAIRTSKLKFPALWGRVARLRYRSSGSRQP